MINGMLYARGHPRDYDEWRQLGLAGWGWDDVLPYFKRSGEPLGRGGRLPCAQGGPLSTTKHLPDDKLFPRFMETVRKLGYKTTRDHHGAEQEGWGSPDINTHLGKPRQHCGAVPLSGDGPPQPHRRPRRDGHPRRGRERPRAGAPLPQGRRAARAPRRARNRAVGRRLQHPATACCSPASARRTSSREHGIDVVHDLPGVGRNLQDHPSVAMVTGARRDVTLNPDLRFDRLTLSVLQWLTTGKGRIANMPVTANGWIKTRPDHRAAGRAMPVAADHHLRAPLVPRHPRARARRGGDGLRHAAPRKPRLGQAGARPRRCRPRQSRRASSPTCSPPRMIAPSSAASSRRSARSSRAGPLADVLTAEVLPGPDVRTDAEVDAWVRSAVNTALHPVGSCAMGTGAEAVCDEQLRVHGIEALRIADASVMPRIPGGNTNAPTIMIGEKAADLIRGRVQAPARPRDRARRLIRAHSCAIVRWHQRSPPKPRSETFPWLVSSSSTIPPTAMSRRWLRPSRAGSPRRATNATSATSPETAPAEVAQAAGFVKMAGHDQIEGPDKLAEYDGIVVGHAPRATAAWQARWRASGTRPAGYG